MTDRVQGTPRAAIVEVLVTWAAVSLFAAVLYRLQGIALLRDNLHALLAAAFLFVPQLVLRGRADLEAYGLRAEPVAEGLRVAAIAILCILPAFSIGFYLWLKLSCAHWPQLVPGSCFHLLHPTLRVPKGFVMLVLAQLVVVALPEELFFRGYVMGRLEDALPPTRTLFGARVGWALVIQAVLFGVGHFVVTLDPAMLTRAIPGLLFGIMYARTRSILAGTIFHATCNCLMEVLGSTFL